MKYLLILLLSSLFFNQAIAQQRIQMNNLYTSPADRLVTIKSISVLPFSGNAKGIYSKPFHEAIKQTIEKSSKWELKELQLAGVIPSMERLSGNSDLIKKYHKTNKADAYIAGKIIRSTSGLNLYLQIYLGKDGLLLAKESLINIKNTDYESLQGPFLSIFRKLVRHIPYEGMILSRNNQNLTLNLSQSDGLFNGQILTIIQLIKINRHPIFNFIVSSEKAILGTVRVTKVDDTLSFAQIVAEKEKGIIRENNKVVGARFGESSRGVVLGSTDTSRGSTPSLGGSEIKARPTLWKPNMPPTFGRIGGNIGLGQYQTTNGPNSASTFTHPSINIEGEVWLTDFWSAHGALSQGIVSVENPSGNNGPRDLSISTSSLEVLGGYNFREAGVLSTKFELLFGYAWDKAKVDAANNRSLTSTTYQGFKVGADIQMPVFDQDFIVGGSFFLFLNPRLKERPADSGQKSENSVTMFKLYGLKRYTQNIYFTGTVKYNLFSTTYNDPGPFGSKSLKNLTLHMGANYYF